MDAADALQRLADTIDAHEWDAIADLLHPSFTCHLVATDERFDAPGWISFNARYPGFQGMTLVDLVGDGERAAARGHVTGPVDGVVLAAHDGEPDHPARRGLPSIRHALTQRRRAARGGVALAGNHVLLEHRGTVVALCHLRQGSVAVRPGQEVQPGEVLGACGNSGNSTEPHVHVQALDSRDIERADAVPPHVRRLAPGERHCRPGLTPRRRAASPSG
ncbi:peptidoglycan DD-metalloendopeptidase family protein [Microbacterium sp. gxy059]|uniref:peptidoglycan DD-metalloendopeptidase family protein n=1 Tax=Microbacterium sp. gxy059 TaxID=2957199 RepID=UPI003D99AB52